jgi:hypothetical protein
MNALWIALNPSNATVADIAKQAPDALAARDHAWGSDLWATVVIVIDMHGLSPIKRKRLLTRRTPVSLCHSQCCVLLKRQAMSSDLHPQLLHSPVLR